MPTSTTVTFSDASGGVMVGDAGADEVVGDPTAEEVVGVASALWLTDAAVVHVSSTHCVHRLPV